MTAGLIGQSASQPVSKERRHGDCCKATSCAALCIRLAFAVPSSLHCHVISLAATRHLHSICKTLAHRCASARCAMPPAYSCCDTCEFLGSTRGEWYKHTRQCKAFQKRLKEADARTVQAPAAAARPARTQAQVCGDCVSTEPAFQPAGRRRKRHGLACLTWALIFAGSRSPSSPTTGAATAGAATAGGPLPSGLQAVPNHRADGHLPGGHGVPVLVAARSQNSGS